MVHRSWREEDDCGGKPPSLSQRTMYRIPMLKDQNLNNFEFFKMKIGGKISGGRPSAREK